MGVFQCETTRFFLELWGPIIRERIVSCETDRKTILLLSRERERENDTCLKYENDTCLKCENDTSFKWENDTSLKYENDTCLK